MAAWIAINGKSVLIDSEVVAVPFANGAEVAPGDFDPLGRMSGTATKSSPWSAAVADRSALTTVELAAVSPFPRRRPQEVLADSTRTSSFAPPRILSPFQAVPHAPTTPNGQNILEQYLAFCETL
jgi:hypothetical protein